MAFTGVLALGTLCSSTNVSKNKVTRKAFSSSIDCSSSTSERVSTEQPFTNSRASPSVRWPHLKFEENNTPDNQYHTSPMTLIETDEHPHAQSHNRDDFTKTQDLNSEKTFEKLSDLDSEDSLGLESSSETLGRHSRNRVKKMNKLALKRAKDWRQRVQFLTDRILKLQPSEFVADVLDDRRVQLTPADFCFVVKWVGHESWHRALEIFEWLNLRHWYTPSPRMLATILAVLGRANQETLAEDIFNRAEQEVRDVVQVYNAMMGVYARHGRFKKVQELLRLMRSRGCEPDLVSFNTLINAQGKSGIIMGGSALGLLYEVRRSGLRPDIITYNTLISACSSGFNLDEAVKVYQDMQSHGCQPDLWTYNAMISVYGRSGNAEVAELLSKELIENGFFPDAVTYNSLLYAFARDGDVEKVDRVCKDMVEAGFEPDEITYNTMIHMYGKRDRHDLAFELYKSMKLAGCNPDAVTYTVLIDSLGKANRMNEAADVLSEMLNAQVEPTLRTFSALICGYAKAGMCAEAEQTFDRMLRSGIKPDSLAYSVIVDVLLRFKETRKAMGFYKQMVRDGFRPDQSLYRFMLKVFAMEGENDYVGKIVGDIEETSGMNPQAICSLLVEGECFDHASEVLKMAVVQGYEPDFDNLLAILNSYCSLGRQTEAYAMLNFLKERAPGSCNLISEALILMLCKANQAEAALEEYSKIKGLDFDQSGTLYEELILCCVANGSYAGASQIFSDMKFYGIMPTINSYKSAVIAYGKLGFPETAHLLVDCAVKAGILFEDSSVYVTLIEAFGDLKLWQRAESLVGRLKLSTTVDRKVWNALINAYAASGLYEQGRAVFNRMMKDGPSPTVDSINGLMQSLVTAGRLDELYVLVQELQEMGFKISKSTVLLMLDAFARAGNIFEVKKIYHGMKAAGFLPTMHLYRSMIGLFARGKRVRELELVVAEMEESGFKPDLIIFNSMLRLYTEIGDFRKTVEVYQGILEAGYKADENTYNTLILMYSKELRAEEALSLLLEMKTQSLEPKLDSYKSLLSACGKQQLWDQAEDLFEEMQSKGCKMDRALYHIMMKIFRNSGNYDKAENILVLMKEAGVEPSVATMHMLMGSYGTAGRPMGAENVLNHLKTSGMDIGSVPYASVIGAYLKNRDYNLAKEMLLQMKKDGVEPDCRIWTCFVRAASLCQHAKEVLELLDSLRDMGFDLPIRLLTEKPEQLVVEVDLFLDKVRSSDEAASFDFVNALEDLLWAFERRATASWVFQMAIRKNIYRHDVFRVADKDWGADFRKLSAGAALVGLTLWLDHMQDASLQGIPESPKSVVLITGTSEYNMVSLNRTLKAYLWEMGSPFLPCKTRTGLLIAKAHSLRMWLKDSAFCMDLELKDAHSLPQFNSMQLDEGCFMRASLVPVSKDINERLGEVRPKKFARLALMSEEKRDKAIRADIEGREEKLEKMMRSGRNLRPRKLKFGRRKFIKRREHSTQKAFK